MSITHPSPWTLRRTIEALIMALLIMLGALIAPPPSLPGHATLPSAGGTPRVEVHRPAVMVEARAAGMLPGHGARRRAGRTQA